MHRLFRGSGHWRDPEYRHQDEKQCLRCRKPCPSWACQEKTGHQYTIRCFFCCPWKQQPDRLYNKETSNMMQCASALTLSRQVSGATYHIKKGKSAFAYQCFRAKELRSIFLKMYLLLCVWVSCLHLYIYESQGYSAHRGQKRTLNPPEIGDTGGLEMVQVI